MAVVSKEDLVKQVKDYIKEDTSDEAIALLENMSDTINSLSSEDVEQLKKDLAKAQEDVEKKDKEWRKKYTERFNSTTPEKKDELDSDLDGDDDSNEDVNEPTKFEDLFTHE